MSASSSVGHSDPDIVGGTPVLVGTRVLVQTLLNYLESGEPLGAFLEDFPSISPRTSDAVHGFANWSQVSGVELRW